MMAACGRAPNLDTDGQERLPGGRDVSPEVGGMSRNDQVIMYGGGLDGLEERFSRWNEKAS